MKAIFLIMAILAVSMLFLGCTQAPAEVRISNESDAAQAITDVGTDLSGISSALDDIDETLADTNSP